MTEKLNLHQKLVEVRKSIGGFTKDAKSFNYSYVSGSQVLSKIQDKMNELGVLLVPKIITQDFQEHAYKDKNNKDKLDFIVHGSMAYTWVNADNPNDSMEIPFYYTGQQDDISKAFGSGLTYSERYFIIKFFNLPTDSDDPDAKDTTGRSQRQGNASPPKPQSGNGITQGQKNAIQAKTNSIAQRDAIGQGAVWENAQKALGIFKRSGELTKAEASKFIDYLSTQEG
ncbi:ERF family protein [Sporosarcina highlanderae]|uniref:ERF family protein n=1 Tax=Sporosarcina highlanderae TaxID=3035916 RepID=A0ABT8JVF0_9BACL|nr:ERF family protein [Sporosarcina highlanderae]MDN4609155.1 ERF family protein [Sporosarcina highlanderae]